MKIVLLEISHFTGNNGKSYSHLKFIFHETTGLFRINSVTHVHKYSQSLPQTYSTKLSCLGTQT